ncbi:outer membrane protein [Bartonella sp. B30(2025)]
MNIKYLMTVSIFAFIPLFSARAADIVATSQPKQMVTPIITSPAFSWTGFYLGGQIGGFSSKISAMSYNLDSTILPVALAEQHKKEKWISVDKKDLPELSGFIGGIYAGVNVDFGTDFIVGVDTDILLSERKDTKTIKLIDGSLDDGEHLTFSHTLKQKWTGATRVRVGYSADCIMPYIAGGVAYGNFQNVLSALSVERKEEEVTSIKLDDTKMMIGYTLGAGVDFAVTNNVILRAEYRYSDFGKKKFNDIVELDYKTNDFRVGVAYKF